MNAPYTLHPRRTAASSGRGTLQADMSLLAHMVARHCRAFKLTRLNLSGVSRVHRNGKIVRFVWCKTKGEGTERLTETLIGWLGLQQLRRNFVEGSGWKLDNANRFSSRYMGQRLSVP
jgi:hypothetical protein